MSDPKATPTLAAVIKSWIAYDRASLRTAMPAKVVRYDAETGLATVQPSLKRAHANGKVVDLPKIIKVPVCFPRSAGGAAFLHMPITKGDRVLLVFSDRSLDAWKGAGSGTVEPSDPRRHHLSDAIAIPGCYPETEPLEGDVDPEAVTLANGDFQMAGKADGKVSIKNSTDELVGLVCDLFDAISTGTTATMLGPQLLVMPTFAALKAKLDAFREGP